MLAVLQALSEEFTFKVSVVDIDADESLAAQYDELVPVLLGARTEQEDMVQLCHYFLDGDKVRAFLLENSAS
jgi:hypothetical protein